MHTSMQIKFADRKAPDIGWPANPSCARLQALNAYDAGMAKDPFKVAFGQRLRVTAAEFGFHTAQSIADLCGAERAAVDTWLNGRATPKWHQAARLCNVWNVTLDWLLLGKPDGLPHGVYIRLAAAMDGKEATPSPKAPAAAALPAAGPAAPEPAAPPGALMETASGKRKP